MNQDAAVLSGNYPPGSRQDWRLLESGMNEPWRSLHECTFLEKCRRIAANSLLDGIGVAAPMLVVILALFIAFGVPLYILLKVF